MKNIILSAVMLMVVGQVVAQTRLPEYDSYIDNYRQFAIESRERYGIPAAITLAQGILESGAGGSVLATECNNHFGIKCGGSWYGKTMTKDDDSAGECFRCYESVRESYDDHSEFLKRQRYAFLFDYAVTDYGLWAEGLRQAGYATDPAYPQKLISIIELYESYLLDGGRNLGLAGKAQEQSEEKPQEEEKKEEDKSHTIAEAAAGTTAAGVTAGAVAGSESKVKEEPVQTVKNSSGETVIVDKTATYTISENNGVKCMQLAGEATFKKISKLVNIPVDRLLYLNDLPEAVKLQAGDYVYLSLKKGEADKSLPDYTVKSGDSMYSISQEFGIRLSALYKMNNMPYGTPARVGQILKLHR